jgi:hypothetical protein
MDRMLAETEIHKLLWQYYALALCDMKDVEEALKDVKIPEKVESKDYFPDLATILKIPNILSFRERTTKVKEEEESRFPPVSSNLKLPGTIEELDLTQRKKPPGDKL